MGDPSVIIKISEITSCIEDSIKALHSLEEGLSGCMSNSETEQTGSAMAKLESLKRKFSKKFSILNTLGGEEIN